MMDLWLFSGMKLRTKFDTIKLVLAVIADNPNLSKEKIAEKIGMSRATVTRAFAKLVEIGAIQRVGSDKSGHWEIVENGE